jgi:hypothetical protein
LKILCGILTLVAAISVGAAKMEHDRALMEHGRARYFANLAYRLEHPVAVIHDWSLVRYEDVKPDRPEGDPVYVLSQIRPEELCAVWADLQYEKGRAKVLEEGKMDDKPEHDLMSLDFITTIPTSEDPDAHPERRPMVVYIPGTYAAEKILQSHSTDPGRAFDPSKLRPEK